MNKGSCNDEGLLLAHLGWPQACGTAWRGVTARARQFASHRCTGEGYAVAFNPEHRWFYFSQMERDEAMLLKCYDSSIDPRARWTAHTAFDDPTSPSDPASRERNRGPHDRVFAPAHQ